MTDFEMRPEVIAAELSSFLESLKAKQEKVIAQMKEDNIDSAELEDAFLGSKIRGDEYRDTVEENQKAGMEIFNRLYQQAVESAAHGDFQKMLGLYNLYVGWKEHMSKMADMAFTGTPIPKDESSVAEIVRWEALDWNFNWIGDDENHLWGEKLKNLGILK